jgi:hypothetical protein
MMQSFMTALFTKYYKGNHIKMNEMSWDCGTYVEVERCTQGFGGKT